MRNILLFAALVLVGSGFFAKYADRNVAPANAPSVAVARAPTAEAQQKQSTGSRNVSVRADSRGHFQVEARVDRRRMDFLVDTGASSIAMRASSAAQLGMHPAARDYTITSHTANGVIKGAPVTLSMVEIGGVVVRDVRAIVLPDEALSTNLLGNTFLARLRRYEVANGKLVMEQ